MTSPENEDIGGRDIKFAYTGMGLVLLPEPPNARIAHRSDSALKPRGRGVRKCS